MNDFAKLAAHEARLRALGSLTQRSVPVCAVVVKRVLVAKADAAQSPDGQPWAPTKVGKRALPGAAGAIEVRTSGTTITARVSGAYALHSEGRARGGVKREILPSGAMPAAISTAIGEVVADEFNATMRGAR